MPRKIKLGAGRIYRAAVLCFLSGVLIATCVGCKKAEEGKLSFEIAAINEGIADRRYYYAMVSCAIENGNTEEMAAEIIRQMGNVQQMGAGAAIAPGTEANRIRSEGNSLEVDMPSGYAEGAVSCLSADGALVLSLCELPGVEYIRITVDGAAPEHRADRYLSKSDFLLDDEAFKRVEYTAELYFADRKYQKLSLENRTINLSSGETPEVCILNALLKGPENAELHAIIPQGTTLLSQYTERGVCYVNFSREFSALPLPQGEARADMTLASIVRSLCALSGIDAVRFAVEGTLLDSFHGVSCAQALYP